MNTNLPLISIVIPTYNHANYLSKAINSIINQTYENWEAIIIDNHSTDHTHKVVNEFNDKRIKYIKINNSGVIAKSRNAGISKASGDWIAFLDSDDWWVKDKLKICIEYFKNDFDLLYHDLEINSNNRSLISNRLVKSRKLQKPVIIDLLVNGNAISNSSVIVKKSLLKEVGLIDENKKLVAAEDYNTWLKISNLTDKFFYLPKRLGYYRMHSQSISRKDMSQPIQQATYKYTSILNNGQKIKLESNIKYLSGRYNYLNYHYKKSKKDLLFTLRNGVFSLRLKSFYMLLMILLNNKE